LPADAGQKVSPLRTSSRPLSGPHDLAFIVVAGYNRGGRGLIEFRQSLTSRGEPSVSSNHFVKSMVLTSCSTRTSATDTLTAFEPRGIPATYRLRDMVPPLHKMQRSDLNRMRNAIHVWIVTRHERTGIAGKISYSSFIRHSRASLIEARVGNQSQRSAQSKKSAIGDIPECQRTATCG